MNKSNAMSYFLQAISVSKQHAFPHEEALANERAGMFCLQSNSTGSSTSALNFFLQSYRCYESWGCYQKMLHLKEKYPKLSTMIEDKDSSHVSFVGLELKSTSASAISALADDGSEGSIDLSINSHSTSGNLNSGFKRHRCN